MTAGDGMFKKWWDENATLSDLLMIILVLFGVIVAFMGLKEIVSAIVGAVTTYVVKDKSKKTQDMEERTKRLEAELMEGRKAHDQHIEKVKADARDSIHDTDIDDLVDEANKRISGS